MAGNGCNENLFTWLMVCINPDKAVKRYDISGQQVVTRLADHSLYYHVNDPTGTSLLMVDTNGDEAGRLLYDGYGAVLTNTLPLTLTGSLSGVPDAATGLAHLGGGRYYDPALGRPLQPNPAGGPPTVPQALNRYAATPLGQPGVYEAAQDNAFNWTPHAVGFAKNTAIELARKIPATIGYTYSGVRNITVRGSYQTLTQNLPDALHEFPGRLSSDLNGARFYKTRIRVEADEYFQIGVKAKAFANELTQSLPDGSFAQIHGGFEGNYSKLPIYGQLDEAVNLNFIRTGIGAALDFGIGFAFQYVSDSQNPYLTPNQVVVRSTASGLGGTVTAFVFSAAFCGSTGGIGCVILAGTGGGIAWSIAQPYVFEMIPGIHPTRNLAPLIP